MHRSRLSTVGFVVAAVFASACPSKPGEENPNPTDPPSVALTATYASGAEAPRAPVGAAQLVAGVVHVRAVARTPAGLKTITATADLAELTLAEDTQSPSVPAHAAQTQVTPFVALGPELEVHIIPHVRTSLAVKARVHITSLPQMAFELPWAVSFGW